MADFPISLDDIKNWYYGITNPSHWSNALNELQGAKNSLNNFRQQIGPTSGTPIPGPPMTFNDVWKRLMDSTNTPGQGATQPSNQSGQR